MGHPVVVVSCSGGGGGGGAGEERCGARVGRVQPQPHQQLLEDQTGRKISEVEMEIEDG